MRGVSRSVAEPLRVLVYEPYPFGKIAGNLRTLLYILRFTDRSRFHLTVAVPFETELVDRIRKLGGEVVVLQPPARVNRYGGRVLTDRWYKRLLTLPDLLRYNRRVYRCLRERGIDVIYCNSIRSLLTVFAAGVLARTPRVWYVKGTLENGLLDRLGFLLANRILFFAESNRDDRYARFVRLFRRKIGIVKIGLDIAEIRRIETQDKTALIREFSLDEGIVGVGYLGQLYAPKGVHFLVEAFARVAPSYPNARLFLMGDPVLAEYREYEGVLRQLVTRLGLDGRVVFTGWREDALAIASQMAVMVHPSMAEGFGRAVLEAMALGLPVIASAVGGLREAVRDGENGYLVAPGDTDAIADRLGRLLGDPVLRRRLGECALATVLREYLIEDKVAMLSAEWAGAARPARRALAVGLS